ncbi:hypothetical protein [Blastococcus mobilis]|uniref:hypothetical protein n=1 Tax=Blastococcus mobilis TaxID=1938746 RepID=UPI00113106BC|nr:hypothetical protein [Blastococcus mobilis]
MPVGRGAHVMVCDRVCLKAASDRLPDVEPLDVAATELCVTCFACGLTRSARSCVCADFGTSCSAPSWLLSAQPFVALDAIYASYGPVVLTDEDWKFLQARAEEVDAGGLVGLLWVREQHPDGDR